MKHHITSDRKPQDGGRDASPYALGWLCRMIDHENGILPMVAAKGIGWAGNSWFGITEEDGAEFARGYHEADAKLYGGGGPRAEVEVYRG